MGDTLADSQFDFKLVSFPQSVGVVPLESLLRKLLVPLFQCDVVEHP